MGHLKPAIRRKQKSVFNPICPICNHELIEVTSNAQASRVIKNHVKASHGGGGITSQLKSLGL